MILIVRLFRQSTHLLHLKRVTFSMFFLFTVTLSWSVKVTVKVFLFVKQTCLVWNWHHIFTYPGTSKVHDYKKKSSSGISGATLWWSSSPDWMILRLMCIIDVDSKIFLIIGRELELYHAICFARKENVWFGREECFDSQHIQQTHRNLACFRPTQSREKGSHLGIF